MRAFSLVTFGAITAMFSLTACLEDGPAAIDKVTSSFDDAGASTAPAATSTTAPASAPRDFVAIKKESRGSESVSSSDAGEDLDAQPVSCGSGAGTRDESQLSSNGNAVISASQSPGQTFTVVTSGILTGIELGLASCNGVDPHASVVLTVQRGDDVIATSSIAASSIGSGSCGGIPLSADQIGSGFFDLSASCVAITSGDHLSLSLGIVGAAGECSWNGQCAGGVNDGNECESNDDCQYVARVGIENSDDYDGGDMLVNGSTTSWDTAFKTFVR